MGDAAAIVLDGPRLGTDPKVIRWPDRFRDDDGCVNGLGREKENQREQGDKDQQ